MPDRRVHEDWAVLRPGGHLDLHAGEELGEEVARLCAAGSSQIVIDLSEVTGASSTGLAGVFTSLRTARAAGGDLRLAGASADLRLALRRRRAHRIFRLHDSVHEAIAAGQPPVRRLRAARRRREG